MAQITYANKVKLNDEPNIPDINKVTDDNMNEIKETVNSNTPTGVVNLFAGTTAPDGWLICDGSAVSRTNYSNLFNVIGTTFGDGDGSTTFNLPDFRHLIPIGLDSRNTAYDTIGKTGGREKVKLSAAIGAYNNNIDTIGYVGDGVSAYQSNIGPTYVVTGGSTGVINMGNHSTVVTEHDVNDRNVNIMQPFIVMNYIISY